MVTQLNFSKFNGCSRQAYLTIRDKNYKSLKDKYNMSSRLRDIQDDMLSSFPDGIWVYGDVKRAAADTRAIIEKGEEVIYNAAFISGGASARCDVIMKENGAYDIYAVRPTSRYTRWIDEVLYSKIIMEKAGVKTGNCYVCAIDREGTREKTLSVINVNNPRRERKLEERLKNILKNISLENIPRPHLTKQCGSCPYLEGCFAKEENSIFTLKAIPFTKKMSLYQKGITKVEEYAKMPDCDERARREIMVRSTDEDVYSKEDIRAFLNTLHYPLGFLDFETMEVFKPTDKILSPMDTVITQFSYHVIESEGAEAVHYEFIGDGVHYCEKQAAKELIGCIGEDHCVLMYSDYEKVCIERLIKRFPKFKKKLEAIVENLVDLEKPFANKFLVNRAMEGKSSLKKVLPALYPDCPSLDYSRMAIKNGQQAESVYARLGKMTKEEREAAMRDLKEYCALDTLAMIKLWEKLEFYGKME
ncbi:MAG: DUF2779 domain-containing protein [Clostridia bacterium]|nr:DUF2779 domain-containing protein [Clostridia bacterium]